MTLRKIPRFPTRVDFFIVLAVIALFLLGGVFIKQLVLKDVYVNVELLSAGGEWWWGTAPPYYWMYPSFYKGAKEYDVLKKPLVEVLDVVYQNVDNRKLALIKARLKVKRNFRTNVYTFRQSQLQVGKTITIAPNNVSMIAHVLSIEGQPSVWKTEERVVTAKLLGVRDWVVNAVAVGDVQKDNDGKPVAEILEKSVQQANMITQDDRGEPHLKKDPLHFDITLKLRLRVYPDGNVSYFNFYSPVQVAQEVEIQLPNITLKPLIMQIEKPVQ